MRPSLPLLSSSPTRPSWTTSKSDKPPRAAASASAHQRMQMQAEQEEKTLAKRKVRQLPHAHTLPAPSAHLFPLPFIQRVTKVACFSIFPRLSLTCGYITGLSELCKVEEEV